MKKHLLPTLALMGLCGCLEVQDELTLNSDGSGSVRLEVKSSASMSGYLDRGGGGNPDHVQYPPTAVAEARVFFPGPDFEVKADNRTDDHGDQTLLIQATFKDVNALLASPYARAHAIELKRDGDALVFRALSGMGAMAHFMEGARDGEEAAMYSQMASAMGGAKELRAEFRLNLPNPVTQANGQREDRSVVWLADRNQTTNATVFLEQVDQVLEARCNAGGVTFAPKGPVRPALLQFSELPSGALGNAVEGPDEAAVRAAAKFVPCALQVQRTVDLSGSGYVGDSQAGLVGFVVLPASLKPQRWGKPELEEVLDANQRSLKLNEAQELIGFPRGFSATVEDDSGWGTDEEKETERPAGPAEERHRVEFRFQSPDWSTKSISKLTGSITLQYGAGLYLAKITNAIPASWIPESTDTDESMLSRSGLLPAQAGTRLLASPELDQLGARITCGSVGSQMGGLTLLLETESDTCILKEVQVYDADGKPCPTMSVSGPMMMDEEGETQILVAGKPKPPLSLGITISGGGTSVKLPIELQDAPLRNP